MNGYLETERLLLKILDETYAEQVLDFHFRNKEFLKEWEPDKDLDYYTLKHTRKSLRNEQLFMKRDLMYKLYIFKKGDPKERVIGAVVLNNIVRGGFQSCFLGYKMDGKEINQGYITEALQTFIDFAFKKLHLHRIEANIMPKNHRSLRVVEKLGFHSQGLAKKYLKINGTWEDHLQMVLLNEEME